MLQYIFYKIISITRFDPSFPIHLAQFPACTYFTNSLLNCNFETTNLKVSSKINMSTTWYLKGIPVSPSTWQSQKFNVDTEVERDDSQTLSPAQKSWLWSLAGNLNRPWHVRVFWCVTDNISTGSAAGVGPGAEAGAGAGAVEKVQMIALTHRVDTIGNTLRLPCSRESNEFCINKHLSPCGTVSCVWVSAPKVCCCGHKNLLCSPTN